MEGELGLYQPRIDPGKYFQPAIDDEDDTAIKRGEAGPGFEGKLYGDRIKQSALRLGIISAEESLDE